MTNKELAYQKVDELADEIEDKLFSEGYMFYSDFKAFSCVAREIIDILNERYADEEGNYFIGHEEETCDWEGIIFNIKIIPTSQDAIRIMQQHYLK